MNSHNQKLLNISHTLKIVTKCWTMAEESLQADIKEYLPSAGEEFITQLFFLKFAKLLDKSSKNRAIEQAFRDDLKENFPDHRDNYSLTQLANGLIANAALHKRKTEEKTGGDLGLMIARPNIEAGSDKQFLYVNNYQCGLLCQAKMRNAKNKWGKFTCYQIKNLNDKLRYLSLLLYSYEDKERRMLKKFLWQDCKLASKICEVSSWLKSGDFPSLTDSIELLTELGNGRIGTDDEDIIKNTIIPYGNTILMITIDWPKRQGPGSQVFIDSPQQDSSQLHIRV